MKNEIEIYNHPAEDRIEAIEQAAREVWDGLKFFAAVMLVILLSLGFVALFLVDEAEVLWK